MAILEISGGLFSTRSIRPLLAATGLAAALSLTATACGPSEDNAADKPAAGSASGKDSGGSLSDGLAETLKKHGVDPAKWKNGEWKNWDKDTWFSEGPDGKLGLVSNISIGPVTSGWLAGPRLGKGAQDVFTTMSEKFGSR
ncbi:hypothetical protein [Streptomyces sp. NPDC058092]|uniref:hypothetical protein n=1 Tax=Streptomyces sp. NPDC058092 TaxID=3346336 RepID=UPI0036E5C2A2